jgi:hypothetical protein
MLNETVNIEMDKICNGITYNGNKCNKKCLDNNNYCIIHCYMNEYTENMLNSMKICNKCFKYKYLTDKTCIQCKTNNFIKCKINNCLHNKSEINEYCVKHQIYELITTNKTEDKIYCSNLIKGCHNIIIINEGYKQCNNCRLKRKREDNNIQTIIIEKDITEKKCLKCKKTKNIKNYESTKKKTHTSVCLECRTNLSNKYYRLKNLLIK